MRAPQPDGRQFIRAGQGPYRCALPLVLCPTAGVTTVPYRWCHQRKRPEAFEFQPSVGLESALARPILRREGSFKAGEAKIGSSSHEIKEFRW